MAVDIRTGASPPPQPQQMVPRCQYCGADPAPVLPAFTQFGTGKVAVWMCANPGCRAVHSVQLVGVEPQQESPIVRP